MYLNPLIVPHVLLFKPAFWFGKPLFKITIESIVDLPIKNGDLPTVDGYFNHKNVFF